MRLALAAKCGALGCEWPGASPALSAERDCPANMPLKPVLQCQLLSYGGFRVAIHWSANQFQVERQVTYSYPYSVDVSIVSFSRSRNYRTYRNSPAANKAARTPRYQLHQDLRKQVPGSHQLELGVARIFRSCHWNDRCSGGRRGCRSSGRIPIGAGRTCGSCSRWATLTSESLFVLACVATALRWVRTAAAHTGCDNPPECDGSLRFSAVGCRFRIKR